MRILVVDDDHHLCQWVVTHLETLGHQVDVAYDGMTAVDKVQAERPDVVLLDILMPGLDGCQTAVRMRKLCAQPYLPILFFTAISDAAKLSECLEMGDGFIQKPVDIKVLIAKIEAFDRWSRMARRLQHQNRKLQAYRARTEQEIEVCRHILRRALSEHRESLPGIRLLHTEASTLSGDLLLMHERPDGGAYLLIGDFTGYGLSAMVAALPVYERFFELARRGRSVMIMARELNQLLNDVLPAQMFMAATLVEVDAQRQTVHLWCGGLPDGQVFGPDGTLVDYLNSAHPPLGVLADARFQSFTRTLTLRAGDRLYLYTDALPETLSESGEGTTVSLETLLAPPGDALRRVHDALVREGRDAQAALRGMTLVEICGGVADSHCTAGAAGAGSNWPQFSLRWVVSARKLGDDSALAAVTGWFEQLSALRPHLRELNLVLTELYQNVRDYQVLGLPPRRNFYDQLEAWQARFLAAMENLGQAEVVIDISSEHEGALTLTVRAQGTDRDHEVPVMSEFGRGLSMVAGVTQAIEPVAGGIRARIQWHDRADHAPPR